MRNVNVTHTVMKSMSREVKMTDKLMLSAETVYAVLRAVAGDVFVTCAHNSLEPNFWPIKLKISLLFTSIFSSAASSSVRGIILFGGAFRGNSQRSKPNGDRFHYFQN